ncbi:SHOCT domain-containing protein [Rufibacter immobilis]|uniref:SHOCT domain-containing protein n=1 Tax=Rufibacter immobilis TaxID=1348778 RepID=UPI0035EF8E95
MGEYNLLMLIGWPLFSFGVGMLGSEREIGFWPAFLISIFCSPLVGLIFTVLSKDKSELAYKRKMYEDQKKQQEALENNNINQTSLTSELKKLKAMKAEGLLTEEEFSKAKDKLLAK